MAATSPIPASVRSSPAARAPLRLLQPLRLTSLWHLTSLDAPTVAVTWTLAFARSARVALPLWLPIALALGAWAVYIGDRLLDARSATTSLRQRHRFHWRHRRLFFPLGLAAFLASSTLFLRNMPPSAGTRNALLALAAALYFAGIHSPAPIARRLRPTRFLPKELLVALIFTLACATPTWARTAAPLTLLPSTAAFILLAWLNCHFIETWESHRRTNLLPSLALAAASSLAALAMFAAHQPLQAALLASAALASLLLACLDRRASRLAPLTLRAAADLVLLAPLALLALR